MYGPSPAERIAMARRLIGRNKLSEALDILNEAIRHDPRFPDTYDTRAEVFEMMGMYPHAQADRHKAADIRASLSPPPAAPPPPPETEPPPPVPQDEEAAEEGEPDAVAEVLDEAGVEEVPPEPEPEPMPVPTYEPEPVYQDAPPAVPQYMGPPRPSVSGALMRAAGVVLFALGFFIAAGVGIYLAIDAVNGDDGSSTPATSTPTALDSSTDANDEATPTGDATETEGVPGTVEDALRGDPYGFPVVEQAWEGEGFTVTVGDFSEDVTGFSEDAVDVTLERDGGEMDMSILMYDDTSAPATDWNLGAHPSPKLDGELPVGSKVWYNKNVVVVVRVANDALNEDAFNAFLELD